MARNKINLLVGCVLLSTIWACDSNKKTEEEVSEEPEKVVAVPDFNMDSAYNFVAQQVDFGPRVPGTTAHEKSAIYLVNKFEEYGAKVQVQTFEVTTFDNQHVRLKNIIASFNPKVRKRILLAAHWDSRPFADKDTIRKFEPIDAANDGASGVGVLLEVAGAMRKNPPDVGVDIILFDGEDWGNDSSTQDEVTVRDGWDTWWCLGSQYWAKHKHEKGYSAYFGILLDMVGAKDAQFRMEGGSMAFAPGVVEKIWDRAQELGYGNYFVKRKEGAITDDHYFVNQNAKIPMVDIVHFDPENGYFGDFHHTHRDNMDIINKKTLEAVGETLMNVIYYE